MPLTHTTLLTSLVLMSAIEGRVMIDLERREVRLPATVIAPETPLEFVCVVRGGPEHESLLRTWARPSAVHAALLAIGLTPGTPASWDAEAMRTIPPTGDGVTFHVERTDRPDLDLGVEPIESWAASIETGEPMGPTTWVFAGSFVADGVYAADQSGHIASLVNFDTATLDVPYAASSSNDRLTWQVNPAAKLEMGEPAVLILRAAN